MSPLSPLIESPQGTSPGGLNPHFAAVNIVASQIHHETIKLSKAPKKRMSVISLHSRISSFPHPASYHHPMPRWRDAFDTSETSHTEYHTKWEVRKATRQAELIRLGIPLSQENVEILLEKIRELKNQLDLFHTSNEPIAIPFIIDKKNCRLEIYFTNYQGSDGKEKRGKEIFIIFNHDLIDEGNFKVLYQGFLLTKKPMKVAYLLCDRLLETGRGEIAQKEVNNLHAFNQSGYVPQLHKVTYFNHGKEQAIIQDYIPHKFLKILNDLLAKKIVMTDQEKLKFALSLVRIISDFHDKGFAFRDVKPENILLDDIQKLFFCDLGFCCSLEDQAELKRVRGSPQYVPKAILDKIGITTGETKEEALAIDMWGVGCILWLLFSESKYPWYDEFSKEVVDYQKITRLMQQFHDERPKNLAPLHQLVHDLLTIHIAECPSSKQILNRLEAIQNDFLSQDSFLIKDQFTQAPSSAE